MGKKRLISFLLSGLLVYSMAVTPIPASAVGEDSPAGADSNGLSSASELAYYEDYINQYENASSSVGRAVFSLGQTIFAPEDSDFLQVDASSVKITGEKVKAGWEVSVHAAGLYQFDLKYRSVGNSKKKIMFAVEIDGKIPYQEFASIQLERPYIYTLDALDGNGDFIRDNRGNQPTPSQVVSDQVLDISLKDAQGRFAKPLLVYLEAGVHTVTFDFENAGIELVEMQLNSEKISLGYADYLEQTAQKGAADTINQQIKLEAEKTAQRSDGDILPVYDKSSSATSPSEAPVMLLNAIGGTTWQRNGQWLEWEFEIPETGYYEISMRAIQGFKYGMTVFRRITIDGELPFDEMDTAAFPYSRKWYLTTLGGDTPYKFYLEKGLHILRAEITAGAYQDVMLTADNLTAELNDLYRSIVFITGTTPDTLRDYQLERDIPDLMDQLNTLHQDLSKLMESVENGLIGVGSETTAISTLLVQLEGFIEDSETIPHKLTTLKNNINALADWSAALQEQPLELDYILIHSPGMELPKADGGFFQELWYKLQQIFYSFSKDYGVIGSVYNNSEALSVWLNLGRDQLQAAKSLTDDSFVKEYGMRVNISLIKGGLIEAVMAGSAPDVALFITRTDPVNLAARNAAVDLTQFEDFDQVSSEFNADNLISYQYKGGCYGLPLTMDFPMMYVRTDIFEELNLEVPETWEELLDVASVLKRNNLEAGVPSGISNTGIFPTLMAQRGMTYFNEDKTATRFSEEAAIESFSQWTDFYTKYGFTLTYNFFNRFRSGEMPIGIDTYLNYNMIKSSAPEIAGLWRMYEVPATIDADGNAHREAVSLASTAAIVLKGDKEQDAWNGLLQRRYRRILAMPLSRSSALRVDMRQPTGRRSPTFPGVRMSLR